MIYFDDVTKENIKKHNPNWQKSFDHSYRILIIGSSGSGKTNSLFKLINQQPDIDQIYSYDEYPHEAKYQFLINKREGTGLKHLNDLLNTQMKWMIFIKILKNEIQQKT